MSPFKSRSGDVDMDTGELYERGLKLRKKIFGGSDVDRRMQSMGEFGGPLQHIVNAYVTIPQPDRKRGRHAPSLLQPLWIAAGFVLRSSPGALLS
jgi:hypothetical protein